MIAWLVSYALLTVFSMIVGWVAVTWTWRRLWPTTETEHHYLLHCSEMEGRTEAELLSLVRDRVLSSALSHPSRYGSVAVALRSTMVMYDDHADCTVTIGWVPIRIAGPKIADERTSRAAA